MSGLDGAGVPTNTKLRPLKNYGDKLMAYGRRSYAGSKKKIMGTRIGNKVIFTVPTRRKTWKPRYYR